MKLQFGRDELGTGPEGLERLQKEDLYKTGMLRQAAKAAGN